MATGGTEAVSFIKKELPKLLRQHVHPADLTIASNMIQLQAWQTKTAHAVRIRQMQMEKNNTKRKEYLAPLRCGVVLLLAVVFFNLV